MKENVKLLFMLFLMIGITACKDGEKENSIHLELSSDAITIDPDGEVQTVYIYSNASWWHLSHLGDEWCNVSPTSGSGDGSFTITADKNSSVSKRTLSLSISYGTSEASVLGTTSLHISQNGINSDGEDELLIPTGLNATKNGGQIYIYWNPVLKASSYNVYRSSSISGPYSSIGITGDAYKYDNSPLSGYNYYKVTAVNSNGKESAMSSIVSCNNTSEGGNETIKPSAPTGVVATNIGSKLIPQIRITWNNVSNATSYKVYRAGSASGTYSQIGSSTANTQLSDVNPKTGTNYYKVKAVNNAGESNYSSYASYTYDVNDVEPCPPTISGSKSGSATLKVTWSFSTSSGCGKPTSIRFRVKHPDNNNWADLTTLAGTTTSYTFAYGMWANSEGFVYMGIIGENSHGSGSKTIIYNWKTNTWY